MKIKSMKFLYSISILSILTIVTGCRSSDLTQQQGHVKNREEFKQKELYCYFFFISDCPASRNNMPKMQKLNETYASYGLQVKGIVSDPVLDESDLEEALEDYPMDFAIIRDDSLIIAKEHNATVTPQVFLYDGDDNLLYSGAVDNYYFALTKHRKIITEKYLEDAIVSALKNKPIENKKTEPIGCRINLSFFDD